MVQLRMYMEKMDRKKLHLQTVLLNMRTTQKVKSLKLKMS